MAAHHSSLSLKKANLYWTLTEKKHLPTQNFLSIFLSILEKGSVFWGLSSRHPTNQLEKSMPR